MDQLLVVTPTPKNTPSVLRTLCRENNYGVSIVACSRVLESLQKKLEQVENENGSMLSRESCPAPACRCNKLAGAEQYLSTYLLEIRDVALRGGLTSRCAVASA